ncbi:restriction endonuclease [Streptomyces verrucosisporus]|uniref:restriction endonuclease n=1 Tax=Streptomyces verrucosisporus TaxID=1695161 RepID=UPI0019D18A78|nr:restriction endonuclease [Streptomyces verrucosisporus]MBN3930829.1 restriction endonuclease [Streptomyces verrucosisporus]
MAISARRRRAPDGRPVFDLRVTALAFVLAAVVLLGVWFAGRVVLEAAGRHPVAAVAVCLIAVPAAVAGLRGGRRFRASRAARRAAAVLTEAAETALDSLEEEVPGGGRESGERTERPGPAEGPQALRYAEPDGADGARPDGPDRPVRPDYEAMEAEEFEQAVAALCERDGCRDVEVVGGAGDLGADVVATAPDGRRVVVQCKRYSDTNKVGSQDVQRFGGTCYTVHEAQVAAVVTTGDFTAPAAEYARQCGILCFDRHALAAWSDGTGPAPWESAGEPPPGAEPHEGRYGGRDEGPYGDAYEGAYDGLYDEGAARA